MHKKSRLREFLEALIAACCLVFLAKVFLFFPTKVEGASMAPTLHEGDKIIVSKVVTYIHHLERGDVVVMKTDDYYVKRIIGLSGDTLKVENDQLYINGKRQAESYLEKNQKEANRLMMKLTEDFGPITIPDNKVFVMGDNRAVSRDSRNGLGFVDKKSILGTVKAVYYPWKRIKLTE